MTTIRVDGKTFEAVSWMKWADVFAFTTEEGKTFTVQFVGYKKEGDTITLKGWLDSLVFTSNFTAMKLQEAL